MSFLRKPQACPLHGAVGARLRGDGPDTGKRLMELHSTALPKSAGFFFFCKLKACGASALSDSSGAVFPTAFAPSVSLHHILVFVMVFQAFVLSLCLL